MSGRDFLKKLRGQTQSPPGVSLKETAWSWLGGFVGLALLAGLHEWLCKGTDFLLIVGSLGASAVLVFGAPKSPLAQPRNVIGGHLISAVIGVAAAKLCAFAPWLASALAVSLSIAVMHLSRTLHPPGGATALIAVIGGPAIEKLGFIYVLLPIGAGSVILVLTALLMNNFAPQRRYPEYWW